VDLSPKCTEACTRRFADQPTAHFYTNNGHSLPMVVDSSVDFAFSFDSLVHAEAATVVGYLEELRRVLKPDGVGFLHHSNYGAYQHLDTVIRPLQTVLGRLPEWARAHRGGYWRSSSVTAAGFVTFAEKVGLRCVGQELVNWAGGLVLMDAISIVTRPESRWDRPNRVVKNRLFRIEARSIRRSAPIYDYIPNAASTSDM
jgi:SAM-dependent methyltransferase